MLIEWKSDFEVGNVDLDSDHKRLAELVNGLGEACRNDPRQSVRLAKLLEEHFSQHCRREEAFMQRAGIPTAAHVAEHEQARVRIAELVRRVEVDPSGPVAEAIVQFFSKWFFDHVVGKDLQLRSIYQAKGMVTRARRTVGQRIDCALGRLKVRTRIVLATLIPTVLAIGLTATLMVEKKAVIADMEAVGNLADHAIKVGNLVHELQVERGLSARYLAGDNRVTQDLTARREQADRMRQGHALPTIDALRSRVSARQASASEMVAGYTATISELLEGVAEEARKTAGGGIANKISAYLALIRGKEQAGQERAIGATGFATSFENGLLARFVTRGGEQNAFFRTYLGLSDDDAKRAFDGAMAVHTDYERIKTKAGTTELGIPPDLWFSASTARIEALKQIENSAATNLIAFAGELRHNAQATFYFLGGVMGALLAAGMAFTFLIVKSVVVPFASLSGAIASIAAGQKHIEVPGLDRNDEIGDMGRTIMVFRAALLTNDLMQAETSVESAFREMRMARRETLTRDFDSKVSEFVSILASSSTEMVATANEMTRIASNTNAQSTTVASASEQTSSNIQTVAAAVEEFSASIREVTRQVQEAASMAHGAVAEAERTDVIVTSLSEAAGRIGAVIALIENIASQTNLLALNATIEAARAGDAGRGFAVVAHEVKQLANQTVKATGDISEQVRTIQDATASAVTAIRDIGGVIRQISGISTSIASAVEQQSAATSEISRNVQEAARGVQEVNSNIDEVSQGAGQTGAAAAQVLQSASDVSKRSEMIKAEVEQFLSEVKVA